MDVGFDGVYIKIYRLSGYTKESIKKSIARAASRSAARFRRIHVIAVSYTHLTLPTILLV